MLFKVSIRALTFEAIIGILDAERTTPQTVNINCNFDYEYQEDFVNYADVAQTIEKCVKEEKFELLETAITFLIPLIHKRFPQIIKIYLEIEKPNILDNAKVSVAKEERFL